MRLAPSLALLALIGCSGSGTEDSDTPECTDGDTQVADSCGLNDRGAYDQECVNGTWEDVECVDPDECTDGDESSEACWDDRGELALICDEGEWVEDGDCELTAAINVSVDSTGAQANEASEDPAISADGQWVAFTSEASNLVADDTNAVADVFLHDLATGTTTLISRDSSGTIGDGRSNWPSISADGRFVAFMSRATNLVASDTNGRGDIFLHDTQTSITTRVSVTSAGGEAIASAIQPAISDDGTRIVFESTDLFTDVRAVLGGTSAFSNIFMHDTTDSTTVRISDAAGGADANGDSYSAHISGTGRYVTYQSAATDIARGVAWQQIWLYDDDAGTTSKLSTNSSNEDADDHTDAPIVSDDGSKVVYFSSATNLVSDDDNFIGDIFLYNNGTTTRESESSTGTPALASSFYPVISGDGSLVAFQSRAYEIVADDGNSVLDDIFTRDVANGTTTLISRTPAGAAGNDRSTAPDLSSDARHAAFVTLATDIVAGDANGYADIIVMPAR
ncbi:MAG: PD40 domain-containing protein [Proteobacteria bacterium]|nr:PD40 domain-containing protein [Pseudomonadota bacterium]